MTPVLLRVKSAICLQLHCLAITGIKKNKTKYSKRTRSLGAMLEFYYIERGLFQSSSDLLYKHRRPKLTLRENVVM